MHTCKPQSVLGRACFKLSNFPPSNIFLLPASRKRLITLPAPGDRLPTFNLPRKPVRHLRTSPSFPTLATLFSTWTDRLRESSRATSSAQPQPGFTMASKQSGSSRNQQRITVDFIGNKSISWVGEDEPSSLSASGHGTPSQSSINPSSPAQPSDSSQPQPLSTQSSDTELAEPTSDSELRERFVDYIKNRIEALQVGGGEGSYAPTARERVNWSIKKKALYMMLAVLYDTSSRPTELNMGLLENWKAERDPTKIDLDDFMRGRYNQYLPELEEIQRLWESRKTEPESEPEGAAISSGKKNKSTDSDGSSDEEQPAVLPATPQVGGGDGRTKGEKAAQKDVPEWYAGRCVLSDALGAQGAHIVPVRALVNANRDHSAFRRCLDTFWPRTSWDTRCPPGQKDEANILPLEAGVHYKWDRYNFAIRPINHMFDDNPCHLWIQMVWLKDTHESGGLASGNWDHFSGTVINCRQDESGRRARLHFPIVDHGDVFLLRTSDPEKYPLPGKGYLEIQFAAHKILSGIMAPGALKDIFRGPAPDFHRNDGPELPASALVPWEWESLLERAGDIGILDTREEEQWRQAFRAYFYEVEQEEAESVREFLDTLERR